ncbi:hypothetical protein ACN47E_006187 [Coniothyrium glycines]
MATDPLCSNTTGFAFMDDIYFSTTQLEPAPLQAVQPDFALKDPFAKRPSVQLNFPDLQALRDFVGGDVVHPLEYSFQNECTSHFPMTATCSTPQSPKSTPMENNDPMRVNILLPTSQCCYPLAFSTLESLRIVNGGNTTGYVVSEYKSLDSVLAITKSAVQSVMQLLGCSCASDPHLAMLYSSITSKILMWYQIAAGIGSAAPSYTSNSSYASSPSTSTSSSPLSTPGSEIEMSFGIQMQPLRFGTYEFGELAQEKLRRQVVARELKNCSLLVDAIAYWTGDGQAQAEFLYDVLGAWLKSEYHRIVTEVEGTIYS